MRFFADRFGIEFGGFTVAALYDAFDDAVAANGLILLSSSSLLSLLLLWVVVV